MSHAYIQTTASFLPGPAIENDDIDRVLGPLPSTSGRLKRVILRRNGIVKRHYALDPETGEPTHTAAQLGAEAVRRLMEKAGRPLEDMDLLACGTSVPEHLTPGHASEVHGALSSHPCEIATTHGVCCSGLMAMKYASLAVMAGGARSAVATGTERTSSYLRAKHFSTEIKSRSESEDNPYIGFDQEFLRYMLSDGAGAALLTPEPGGPGLSLKVHWIDLVSFANDLPTCMHMGAERMEDGSLRGWSDASSLQDAIRSGQFNMRQDVELLQEHVVDVSTRRALDIIGPKRDFRPDQVDWVVPHYSSEIFREKSLQALRDYGCPIDPERCWSTLSERGNTGCASIYIMLNDLMESGQVEAGQRIALMVPESGRFTAGWALLEAVQE